MYSSICYVSRISLMCNSTFKLTAGNVYKPYDKKDPNDDEACIKRSQNSAINKFLSLSSIDAWIHSTSTYHGFANVIGSQLHTINWF